jgi:hypothetical protein
VIASEFRAAKRSHAGAALRMRLRQAIAAEQATCTTPPSWSAWQQRRQRLEQRVPGFLTLMQHAHGGVTVVAPPDGSVADATLRAAWMASREPVTPARIVAQWQRYAHQYGLRDDAVTFAFAAPRGCCRVVAPGYAVQLTLPDGDSAAVWHDCLHEMGHAIVALLTSADVPRAVDEAVAEVIAADLERDIPVLAAAAADARARRLLIAQRLAGAEATGIPLAQPQVPWALWHDPGVQTAYVAAHDAAALQLADGLQTREALLQFVAKHSRAIDGGL